MSQLQHYKKRFSESLRSCQHTECDRTKALLYCAALAAAYVASLYLLVPSRIRQLDRDHHTHIQYRCVASMVVCLVAIGIYPFLYCDDYSHVRLHIQEDQPNRSLFSLERVMLEPYHIPGVLGHTIILYIGPILASLFRVYEIRRRRSLLQGRFQQQQCSYPVDVVQQLLRPTIQSFLMPDSRDELWMNIRNFVVAPWTEEIIFRGCMVPPLLASGMSPLQVSLVAPLFFGIAHIHHAMIRLSKGERVTSVLLMTIFQFLYTSLFGSYASYAYIRTGSVLAVTAGHTYCNWMGLPDLSFGQTHHPMYRYRLVLLASFLLGVFTFKWSFSVDWLLPLPAELTKMVQT
jgi:prenyl protein peptidase